MSMPPNRLALGGVKLGIVRLKDSQLVRNDAVTIGSLCWDYLINSSIFIISHAIPDKATAFSPLIAFNFPRPSHSEIEINHGITNRFITWNKNIVKNVGILWIVSVGRIISRPIEFVADIHPIILWRLSNDGILTKIKSQLPNAVATNLVHRSPPIHLESISPVINMSVPFKLIVA